MKTIEVLKDTIIVENNTADSLAVQIKTETPVFEYTAPDGTIIKGDSLTKTVVSHITKGELKDTITRLEQQIRELNIQLEEAAMLLNHQIEPAIADAIAEILSRPGSEDRRTILSVGDTK